MKNQLLLYSIFLVLTSCTALRRGSSNAATTSQPARSKSSSPVFLENIAVNAGNTHQRSSGKKVHQVPASGQAIDNAIIPGMSVELILSEQFKYAILLDVPVEEITNSRLIEYIEGWYGTPYRYGGSDKSGVDCSSFVQSFMQFIYNVTLPRTSIEQYRQTKRIKKSALQEGDLVFFNTRGRRNGVSHVGVYLRNNKFVHASTSGGVVISGLDEVYYMQKYTGAGRVE